MSVQRLAGQLKALCLLLTLALSPTTLWAAFYPLPLNWQPHSIDLPEVNGLRVMVGEYSGTVLMNLAPDPDQVGGATVFFPVLFDSSNQRYAVLVDGWPLKWLDASKSLKAQLSTDELSQLASKSAVAYSLKGDFVSGLYQNFTGQGDDRKIASWGGAGFSIPTEASAATDYVALPRPEDTDSNDIIIALYLSQDGLTSFGVVDRFSQYDQEPEASSPGWSYSSQDSNAFTRLTQPAATEGVKYYFWERTMSSGFTPVAVDFSADEETEQMLAGGNGTLMVVGASTNGKTIAVNRVPANTPSDAAADESVAGIITLTAAGPTWSRLPATASSRIFTMTADGSQCLVQHADGLYQLPVSAVKQTFSSPDADKYRLPGRAVDYFFNGMPDMDSRHVNATDSVFSGQLLSGSTSSYAVYPVPENEPPMFFPIWSMLAMPQYQTQNASGVAARLLNFTAVAPGKNVDSTRYLARVRPDASTQQQAGYYEVELPNVPTAVPASISPLIPPTAYSLKLLQQYVHGYGSVAQHGAAVTVQPVRQSQSAVGSAREPRQSSGLTDLMACCLTLGSAGKPKPQ